MVRQIYALTVKELKVLFADRGAVTVLFLMPVVFILVMTVALQGVFQVGSEAHPLEVLVVNRDRGPLAAQALEALEGLEGIRWRTEVEGRPVDREEAVALVEARKAPLALVFPADFSEGLLAGGPPPNLELLADPTLGRPIVGPVRGAIQGIVGVQAAAIRGRLEALAVLRRWIQDLPPAQAAPLLARLPELEGQGLAASAPPPLPAVQLVRPGVEEAAPALTSAQQNVPAYAVFGLFFLADALASSLFAERQEGTFRRLQVAPLGRGTLLLGKLLPYYLVSLLQVALMFAVGRFAFGLSLGSAPLALLAVTLAAGSAATGLGLLVAALARSPRQASGLTSLLLITLAAVGGTFVPSFVMPRPLQLLSRLSPHAWALAGYQDVLVRGLGLRGVLPEAGVLLAFALAFYGVALTRFRWT